MDNVRLRRLKADHEALRRLAHLHPKIAIEGVFGNPPERYRLVLKVKSLRERGETIEIASEHRLEITMPRGYPRDAPMFRMLTPVFHPNIAPHAVCIGDDWTAGEPLDLLIQRVGEILAYQSYNIKSPLNGRAAQWVEQHPELIPIDREEFFLDLAATPPRSAEMAVPACSNCGGRGGELRACGAGHLQCADCAIHCPSCGRLVCLSCGHKTCQACLATQLPCKNCGAPTSVGSVVCAARHLLCADCGVGCATCSQVLCLVCGTYPCRTCAPRPSPQGQISPV